MPFFEKSNSILPPWIWFTYFQKVSTNVEVLISSHFDFFCPFFQRQSKFSVSFVSIVIQIDHNNNIVKKHALRALSCLIPDKVPVTIRHVGLKKVWRGILKGERGREEKEKERKGKEKRMKKEKKGTGFCVKTGAESPAGFIDESRSAKGRSRSVRFKMVIAGSGRKYSEMVQQVLKWSKTGQQLDRRTPTSELPGGR